MKEIKIGKRTIPLYYSTYEMIAIQDEIGCTAYQMKEEVFGIHLENPDDPGSATFGVVNDPQKVERLGKLIRILGNAGLEEAGQPADLTDKWVLRHMRPGQIMLYAMAMLALIVEGNQVEMAEDSEQTGPVDEILEEENAKKQPGS